VEQALSKKESLNMVSLTIEQKRILLERLLEFVNDRKKQLFYEVLANRTRHITVVLEDIYQSQNSSAVIRSADSFGLQDIHVLEQENEFSIFRDIALGSGKWLTIKKYPRQPDNTRLAYEALRTQGYQIIATTPHQSDLVLEELNIEKKTALVLGNELHGLSDYAINEADYRMRIPMFGFAESFNISVSASICMHYLNQKLRNSNLDWSLSEVEKTEIMLSWIQNIVKSANQIKKMMFPDAKW
jgi:tRNA (guanosine-2'-O-)-methyltransferase